MENYDLKFNELVNDAYENHLQKLARIETRKTIPTTAMFIIALLITFLMQMITLKAFLLVIGITLIIWIPIRIFYPMYKSSRKFVLYFDIDMSKSIKDQIILKYIDEKITYFENAMEKENYGFDPSIPSIIHEKYFRGEILQLEMFRKKIQSGEIVH